MLVFLDTEFTDFIDMELISIGMVTSDGNHQLYLERDDIPVDRCSSFVYHDIIPLMDGRGGHVVPYFELAYLVKKWLSELPYDTIEIVVDYRGDWMLLRDMWTYGQYLPENMRPQPYMLYNLESVEQESLARGISEYWAQHPEQTPHRADHDAAANRAGYLYCLGQLY